MDPFTEVKNPVQIVENHKLHVTGIAAAAILKGQFVKLKTDGEILPWDPTADSASLIIGLAAIDAAIDAEVTYAAKGYAVIKALWGANTQVAGLVTCVEAHDATENRYVIGNVATGGEGKIIGWALTPGDDTEETEVILFSAMAIPVSV